MLVWIPLAFGPQVTAQPSPIFNYTWSTGQLSGPDLSSGVYTVEEAEAVCSAMPLCLGFHYKGTNSTTDHRRTYFKASGRANATESAWSSWAKEGILTPPALTAVVGSSNLTLSLRSTAFTIQSLSPQNDPWNMSFSFPRSLRSSGLPGQAHVGDVTIRLLQKGGENDPKVPGCTSSGWATYSTAMGIGATAVEVAHKSAKIIASHDVSPLLIRSAPNGSDPFPLKVVRTYEESSDGRGLVMRFDISLPSDAKIPATIGGLGFPMPEGDGPDNLGPSGIETSCWNEAHIGGDHGFVEYVRVVDDEATLLITQEPGYNTATRFEAWRPLLEDTGPGGWNNEWLVHSQAWAEDWACSRQHPFMDMAEAYKPFYPAEKRATPWPCADGDASMTVRETAKFPWLEPTSKVINPGESITLAFRLQRAPPGSDPSNTNVTGPGPRTRNALLESIGEPVLHGVPGFVLSSEMQSARLIILPPAGATVTKADAASIGIGGGAIEVGTPFAVPNSHGYVSIPITATSGETRGRVTVSVYFSDGTVAAAHYYVIPPFSTQVERLGTHLAQVAWLPRDYPDPFGRSASVMPFDRETGSHVLNDARAYDVGLSDDAGGGNPLCLASKVHAKPTQDHASRVDDFIKYTLYGIKSDTAKPPFKSLQVPHLPFCPKQFRDLGACFSIRAFSTSQ